jgi:hypothetical protein
MFPEIQGIKSKTLDTEQALAGWEFIGKCTWNKKEGIL